MCLYLVYWKLDTLQSLAFHTIDKEHTIQVVHLVLDAASQQPITLDRVPDSFGILESATNPIGPINISSYIRKR